MHPVGTLVRNKELRDDEGAGLAKGSVSSAADISKDLLKKMTYCLNSRNLYKLFSI